jgi:hypothetical protein
VGLNMIYEDLDNGMTRVHSAENLASRNRLHQDLRCDGKFWTLSSDGNHFMTLTSWQDRNGNARPANERRFTGNAEHCLNHAQDERFRECVIRTRPRQALGER